VNWEVTDQPHAEHAKSVRGGRCPLLALREAAGIQPGVVAVEQGLLRTPANTSSTGPSATGATGAAPPSLSSAAAAAAVAEASAAIDRARADARAREYVAYRVRAPVSSGSVTAPTTSATATAEKKQDKTDPLYLPMPAELIQAAVYSTPTCASSAPNSTTPSYSTYSYDPLTGSSSSSAATTPLSAFERVRHRHLKRLRSVWSAGEYASPAPCSSPSPSPSPASSASTVRIESALAEARAMAAALERRSSSLQRKRARKESSGSGGSGSGSREHDAATNMQAHMAEIQQKIAKMEAALNAPIATTSTPQPPTPQPLISAGLMRTIFIQELATAMLTD
jgi:hypothetical protein